jgi:CubicO group peptidase (beta-lactamase class C family)
MSAEEAAVPLKTEIDALFGQHVAAGQSPGLAYGMTTADGLDYSGGFGFANADGLVPDTDTIFPIASMSKSFVAAAALIARDRGLLSLTDPITKYVPEFVVANIDADTEGIPTVEMLFSMCGGLTEDNSWVDPFIDLPTEELLAQVAKGVRLSRYPGAAFEYSNLGFTLAGIAVSREAGQRLEDFVRENLFEPLGLTNTHFDSDLPEGGRRATGYAHSSDDIWVPFEPQRSDAFAAAGGIVSTVRDLAVWITWLGSAFRPRRDDDIDVLSRVSRREMQRAHVNFPPALIVGPGGAVHAPNGGYALGLVATSDLHTGTVVTHSGGLPGFRLFMIWHPESGNGCVALTNSQRGDAYSLVNDALGRTLRRTDAQAVSVRLWPETMALSAQVESLIRQWDDELAAQVFSGNVDFERPLSQRRAEIEEAVAEIGPLRASGGRVDIVSAVTAADVTWSIPGENGQLLCMIHLTPVDPPQVQELIVRAASGPRATVPTEIAPARAAFAHAAISPTKNVLIEQPDQG